MSTTQPTIPPTLNEEFSITTERLAKALARQYYTGVFYERISSQAFVDRRFGLKADSLTINGYASEQVEIHVSNFWATFLPDAEALVLGSAPRTAIHPIS